WTDIKGNFGPAGAQMDLSKVSVYESVGELLEDPKIDLVDITLPPALHAEVAVKALRAGKHVFCEKPMSLTTSECKSMSEAARKADRLLMIGHVLPYFPEYAWALKTIESGRYGVLLGGSFRRVISDPQWLTHYWDAARIGGPMLDLHVHDAHFIRLAFGQPEAVTTTGRMRGDLAEHWTTQFDYGPEGPAVTAVSGTIGQQGRSFNHGFEIHLEKATLAFEFAVVDGEGAYLCPPTLYDHRGKVQRPALSDGDPMHAFEAELKEATRCAKNEVASGTLDASLAYDAIVLCHAQTKSLAQRRRIKIS
ncbi:MAG: Gfo/Idh/MocA family oxidoreductase, partial [Planctomycetales bacterium]|nr:Gfo/Idh/MocA family oxidoreductase [Planctomycetales bacterium]